MKDAGDRTLMIGAFLIALIVAAVAWFLAISPKLASAQTAKDETVAQQDLNFQLGLELARRQAGAEALPDYIREIQAVREYIPPEDDVPGVRRLIDEIAKKVGVEISVDRVTPAAPITGGLSLEAAMADVGLMSEIEGSTFTSLEVVQQSIEIQGPVSRVLWFLDELRSSNHRYIQLSSFTMSIVETEGGIEAKVTIGAAFFILDRNNPAITVRPEERPWPGTEEQDDPAGGGNIFDPIVEPGRG